MTSPSHYKNPVSILDAIKEINKNSGSQFDPEISQVINRIYHDNYEFLEEIVKSAYVNNELEAIIEQINKKQKGISLSVTILINYSFTVSLRAFPALNAGTIRAGICISSPV
jgi:hypothetical protein